MLIRLRWRALALVLAACGPEDDGTKPSEPETHEATATDAAATKDAPATKDAATTADPAATKDVAIAGDAATVDTSTQGELTADAALGPGDAATLDDWRAQAEGPPAEPRVVCERSWATTPFYDLRTPHADPLLLTSGADGSLFVAGYLDEAVDFGTGALHPPLLPIDDTPRRSTFLLKVDSACKLVWAKSFDPADDKTGRWPLALGLDGEGNVALVTNSMRYTYYSRFINITANQFDFVVLGQDGAVHTEKSYPSTSGARAQVSKQGQVLLTTPLGSDGTWGLGDVTVRGEWQRWGNASFRTDGTFLRSEAFSISPQESMVNQALGPRGEIAIDVGSGADYYGQKTTDVSLIELDAEGHVKWNQPVQRSSPDDIFSRMISLADDGALDVFQTILHGLTQQVPSTLSFRELAPDGTLVWEVPVIESESYAFVPYQLASSNDSLAVHLSLHANAKIGNVQLTSDDNGHVVLQIARGGAVRWAKSLSEIRALTTTPSDEVAVLGVAGPDGTFASQSIFVRKYAR